MSANRDPARWTWPQRLFMTALCLASLGTAGPAGYSIYKTSVALVRPYLGPAAWILPVACEAAYIVLFGWGVMLLWRKVADIPVRALGSALIAALSFAIQVYAGRHSAADVLARLAIVASFFVTGATMKAALMRLRGGKVRAEGISAGEWAAHPVHSLRLWRWRKTWGGMDLGDARALYLVLLYVIAVTQAHPAIGTRWRWRSRLPVTLRYELSMGILPDAIASGSGDWQQAVREHVREQLVPLAGNTPQALPQALPEAPPAPALEVPPSEPGTAPEPAPRARSQARSGVALKLTAARSRSMSAGDLMPHVLAMLEAYGDVPEARVKRDLHVGSDKAGEALRLAKRERRDRTVVPMSARQ